MKNSFITKVTTLLLFSTVISCASSNKQSAEIDQQEDLVIATYSNGEITESQLDKELDKIRTKDEKLKNISIDNLSSAQTELLIKEIILREAALKEAKRKDLDDKEPYVSAHKEFESQFLQKQLYVKLAKDATTEEKVKAKYEELVKEAEDKSDLKLGFILLKTEKEANIIHKRLLKKPQNFYYYAKTKSIDEATKKTKGILDFAIETSYPKRILNIVNELKKDQISKPFKLSDKWGIIKLIDKRKAKIRSFEESKENLSQNMALKAIQDFNDQTIKKAEINLIVK